MPPPGYSHHAPIILIVGFVEYLLAMLFTTVGFHYFQVVEGLFICRHHVAKIFLSSQCILFKAFANLADEQNGRGDDYHEKQKEFGTYEDKGCSEDYDVYGVLDE